MRHFGNLKNIREAGEDEIAALPGMSAKTAAAVHDYFSQENE